MTSTNQFISAEYNKGIGKAMLIGAAINLVLISLLVLPVQNPRPEWGQFWMVRPLLVVPIVGAGAGAFFNFLLQFLGKEGGIKKVVAIIIGTLAYVISLWLGTVLGCAGTLWD